MPFTQKELPMLDGELPPPLRMRKRWRIAMAVGFVAAIAALIAGLMTHSGDSADDHNDSVKSRRPHASASPSPTHASMPKIPDDAGTLLSESQARSLSGVPTLHWVVSGGSITKAGRTSSDTRYAVSSNFYPDRSQRYVEVSIYRGTGEYNDMYEQSFDATTGRNDWNFVDTRRYPQLMGANMPFISVRYAKDGSVIRMLGFMFRDVSMKIEVCNLPTADLMDAAKLVIPNLEQLYHTQPV